MKLLIIEDEKELLNTIETYLKSEGYICEKAASFAEGIEKTNQYNYDCVIADIGLPDGNGLDIIKELKVGHQDTASIIISARSSLNDKIVGLNIGADDYLTKPFHLPELNARLNSVIRRRKFQGYREVSFNEIKILTDAIRVEVLGKAVLLTKKEYDLLLYFVSNKEKILPKETIIRFLWSDYITYSDTHDFIYTHISNLRKKLIDAGARDYVKTVYKIGYRFSEA